MKVRLEALKNLACTFGFHDDPVRDRSADGTKVWRCPRCSRVRPREIPPDPLAAAAKNTDTRFQMPAREVYELRQSAVRALSGIEVRRLGRKVLPFRKGA